jgi:hypothetical protein
MAMTVCPICKPESQSLPPTGQAIGYDCQTHGKFKVSDSVFAETRTADATREQWEAALARAKKRAKTEEPDEPDGWPTILTYDFF